MRLILFTCVFSAVLFSQSLYAAKIVLTSPKAATKTMVMSDAPKSGEQNVELRSQDIQIIQSAVEQLRELAKEKNKEPTIITLGLFDDVKIDIVLSSLRIAKNSLLLASGNVEGESFSTAVIVADENNNVGLTIRLPEKKRIYKIKCDPTNGYRQTVSEIDESLIKYQQDAPAIDLRKTQIQK